MSIKVGVYISIFHFNIKKEAKQSKTKMKQKKMLKVLKGATTKPPGNIKTKQKVKIAIEK